jgi:hypothetical protein
MNEAATSLTRTAVQRVEMDARLRIRQVTHEWHAVHGRSTWKARAQIWQAFLELRAGCTTAYDEKIYPALNRDSLLDTMRAAKAKQVE